MDYPATAPHPILPQSVQSGGKRRGVTAIDIVFPSLPDVGIFGTRGGTNSFLTEEREPHRSYP